MKKNSILILVFFVAGFLTHAFLFPDFLTNGIIFLPSLTHTAVSQNNHISDTNSALVTKIYFDGSHFSRKNIAIGVTRYIFIENINPDNMLMWLISNTSSLTTERGYAYKEALQVQMNQKGQFIVADKNNPQERLVITVK